MEKAKELSKEDNKGDIKKYEKMKLKI